MTAGLHQPSGDHDTFRVVRADDQELTALDLLIERIIADVVVLLCKQQISIFFSDPHTSLLPKCVDIPAHQIPVLCLLRDFFCERLIEFKRDFLRLICYFDQLLLSYFTYHTRILPNLTKQ